LTKTTVSACAQHATADGRFLAQPTGRRIPAEFQAGRNICESHLAHDRRRILHVNVTQHPTSAWIRQQLREAFPNDANVRLLLHDPDTTFDTAFGRAVKAFGLTAVRTAPRSPWQNPYVERVIGSIRRECLDHVIAFNERHLRRVPRTCVAYYQRSRTNLALGNDAPWNAPSNRPAAS
jgi:putative transposase